MESESKNSSDQVDFMQEEALLSLEKKGRASHFSKNACCILLVVSAVLVLSLLIALGVALGVTYYEKKSSSTSLVLVDNIRIGDIMELLRELQNTSVDGSRFVSTGYNKSGEFVMKKLNESGYNVKQQIFSMPLPSNPISGEDSLKTGYGKFSMSYSSGDQNYTFNYAEISQFVVSMYSAGCNMSAGQNCRWPVRSILTEEEYNFGCDPINESLSEQAVMLPFEFEEFKGGCPPYIKAVNAKAAGGSSLIFVTPNNGFPPATVVADYFGGGTFDYVDIVSIGISNQTAEQVLLFMNLPGTVTVTIETFTYVTNYTTYNIFAETTEGRNDSIIMFGSHLDSVLEGPGINDDGSGSMVNLFIATEIARLGLKPKNKIRFSWWGAEELGLVGSDYYVNSLTEEELAKIKLYLNFDMLGSTNYIRGIQNATKGRNGDLYNATFVISNLFIDYFKKSSLTYEILPVSGRSDDGPFLDANIPVGALHSGSDAIKTEKQVEKFGGILNVPLDPCYHQACDTIENVNEDVLEDMAKSASYTLEILMMKENLVTYLQNGPSELRH